MNSKNSSLSAIFWLQIYINETQFFCLSTQVNIQKEPESMILTIFSAMFHFKWETVVHYSIILGIFEEIQLIFKFLIF